MANKIVRSICYFADEYSSQVGNELATVAKTLEANGYLIQTKRVCSPTQNLMELSERVGKAADYISVGALPYEQAVEQLPVFLGQKNLIFNLDLSDVEIEQKHVGLLFRIIKESPSATFNFTYVFNNSPSSPFFPSGSYQSDGFSIGLQPTDLGENLQTLREWLEAMKVCWDEINGLFQNNPRFLGIDSSTAPLSGSKSGSLVGLISRFGYTFEQSATTDLYLQITRFIKEQNPKPAGLCGLMLPCLEDDELAAEYDAGRFSVERNIYLSLHSGLGIDTYPIGVDERPERVTEILKLVQALSNKYKKPLSARFVSDGRAGIGDKTDFQNQYLTDCTIRPL